ncbi:MAG: helix-turn-helix domain-containing protein [Clostridiales bacterium]|nr:helix-turn-helix domain-containing protein [Clostridiales bacterium]
MAELKEVNVILGENIKQIRIKQNITREQLAERINVSPRFLADVESGKVGASLTTLKKLSTVLNVSADYLLGFEKFDEKNIYLNLIENKLKNLDSEVLAEVDCILDSIIKINNIN